MTFFHVILDGPFESRETWHDARKTLITSLEIIFYYKSALDSL